MCAHIALPLPGERTRARSQCYCPGCFLQHSGSLFGTVLILQTPPSVDCGRYCEVHRPSHTLSLLSDKAGVTQLLPVVDGERFRTHGLSWYDSSWQRVAVSPLQVVDEMLPRCFSRNAGVAHCSEDGDVQSLRVRFSKPPRTSDLPYQHACSGEHPQIPITQNHLLVDERGSFQASSNVVMRFCASCMLVLVNKPPNPITKTILFLSPFLIFVVKCFPAYPPESRQRLPPLPSILHSTGTQVH